MKRGYTVDEAMASLDDIETLKDRVETLVLERDRLYQGLVEVDYLRPYPSNSNFILNRVRGRDAGQLKQTLEARGILVRYYRTPGLQDCIRISVGTPQQNTRVLAALKELRI